MSGLFPVDPNKERDYRKISLESTESKLNHIFWVSFFFNPTFLEVFFFSHLEETVTLVCVNHLFWVPNTWDRILSTSLLLVALNTKQKLYFVGVFCLAFL